jgi:hypothetical protein
MVKEVKILKRYLKKNCGKFLVFMYMMGREEEVRWLGLEKVVSLRDGIDIHT